MVTGSQGLIRDMNTQLVLNTIMSQGPISRATIATKLGLTKATISAIVQTLIDRFLVLEVGSGEVKKGRRPILLELNKDCGYVISIDLSVEYITVLTANLMGENCFLKRYPNNASRENILTKVEAIIAETINHVPNSHYKAIGIALAIHGVVDNNKVVFFPYSPYEGISFAKHLEKTFKLPVILENEANLSALGEWAYSFHKENLLNISIHSGIGLGIVMNNQLISGQDGYAGEFGHTIIEADGRVCPCGNLGCLEQYASERILLKELSEIKGRKINAEDFAILYGKKDPDAVHTMSLFIKYIAIGINNLLHTFNPDTIVINSSFTMYFPEVCDAITDQLHNTMRKYCHLVPSKLQDTSILLGGVYLCSRSFLGL